MAASTGSPPVTPVREGPPIPPTAPPVWVHEKPLIAIDTAALSRSASGPGAVREGFSVSSMFIDDTTDDLVVLTMRGEIFIYRLGLYGSSSTPCEVSGTLPLNCDALYVATGTQVQIAKCCPLPNPAQTSFMVAVCHNEEQIAFYMPAPAVVSKPSGPKAVPLDNEVATTAPFAAYVCAPKNLRFRNRFYPIRTMYWLEARHQPPTSVVAGSLAVGPRPGSLHRKHLIVLTQISVELLSVSEDLYGADAAHVSLLVRISTRVDYWAFLASGSLRCAVAINEAKPTICKPFAVERLTVLTPMQQLTLEDLPRSTDAFVSSHCSSHMDAPRMQLQVAPLVLYGTLHIMHVTTQRNIVLHRFVAAPGLRREGAAAEGGTAWGGVQSAAGGVMGSASASLSTNDGGTAAPSSGGGGGGGTSATSSSVFQSGMFEPFCVLQVAGVDPTMLLLDIFKVQVVDNLLFVHLTHTQRSVFFDIGVGSNASSTEWPSDGDVLPRGPSEASIGGSFASVSSGGGTQTTFATSSKFYDPAGHTTSTTPRDRSASPQQSSPRAAGNWFSRLSGWGGGTPTTSTVKAPPALRWIASHIHISISAPASHDATASTNNWYTSVEVYNGRLPMSLDRQTGDVRLLMVNTENLAQCFTDIPQRMQFLLNRKFCNPSAVPHLLCDLLLEQEPLPSIAQSLDALCNANLRLAQCGKRKTRGVGSQGRSHGTWSAPQYPVIVDQLPIVNGSGGRFRQRLQQLLLAPSSKDGNHRAGAPQPIALLALDDVWGELLLCKAAGSSNRRRTAAVGGADDNPVGARIHHLALSQWDEPMGAIKPHTDQSSIYRMVFGPLSHRAASVVQCPTEKAPSVPTETTEPSTAPPPSNRNRYNESVYFANYLLNALLEYTRSLVQHGETLSDATQRCLVNMFLQHQTPDFFRLHQLLMYRAIDDHVPTALQLITLERKYPPALQMGLDMLARLNATNEIVQVLLARQTPLLAAKYIVSSRLDASAVSDVLLCAALLHDEERRQLGLPPLQPPSSPRKASPRGPAVGGNKLPVEGTAQQAKKEGSLTSGGSQFYTVFALLHSHFECLANLNQVAAFDEYRARFETIQRGACA